MLQPLADLFVLLWTWAAVDPDVRFVLLSRRVVLRLLDDVWALHG